MFEYLRVCTSGDNNQNRPDVRYRTVQRDCSERVPRWEPTYVDARLRHVRTRDAVLEPTP
jgi:hypothetical protein